MILLQLMMEIIIILTNIRQKTWVCSDPSRCCSHGGSTLNRLHALCRSLTFKRLFLFESWRVKMKHLTSAFHSRQHFCSRRLEKFRPWCVLYKNWFQAGFSLSCFRSGPTFWPSEDLWSACLCWCLVMQVWWTGISKLSVGMNVWLITVQHVLTGQPALRNDCQCCKVEARLPVAAFWKLCPAGLAALRGWAV